MSITIDGKERRIGLALSGGGFRAAAFHLGVMRRLEELGLLRKIDVFTCVSGGSIAGATVVFNWADGSGLDKLEEYLTTKSVAVRSALVGALDPFSTRLDVLARSYDRDLFSGRLLKNLTGPRIYLNTTNLVTGNLFSFVAGGEGPAELGEHELDFEPANDIRISSAVAASSAFPPVFPPLKITKEQYSAGGVSDYVTLTDGGVYDNLGVNPVFLDRNDLDYAIVSDGGKPLEIDDTPTEAGSGVLKESIGILMEQVRGLQFKRLELAHKADTGPKPLWFSIDSEKGQDQEGDAVFASSVRTHLKKLSPPEIAVLKRHGAALVKHRIDHYAPELLASHQT